MKICHVINSLNRGGAESHLLDLINAQLNDRMDVHVTVIGEDNVHKVKEMMTNDITEDIRVNDGEHYDVLRNVLMQQLDNVKEKQRDNIRSDIGIRKKTFNQCGKT